jgi:coproporphyrinogen III oxidase
VNQTVNIDSVRSYLLDLQARICASVEALDGATRFIVEDIPSPDGGLARPRVLDGGPRIEKAAAQFTHSIGASLPPAATERNPSLAGLRFQAIAVSVIVHPRNPYVPTTHMNVRFFYVHSDPPTWYFGGGFDLTPYYAFAEDCRHWHVTAKAACEAHGADLYPMLKKACDDYFYLSHRKEPRGIGGLFFDDWTRGGFDASFAFVRSVGDAFLPAYVPIAERRLHMRYGAREEEFLLIRRGRYAEFNLVWDRGTRYGLQSGRRVESVLASLPPRVVWRYDYRPEPGSPEAALTERFLPPRDWTAEAAAVDKSGD